MKNKLLNLLKQNKDGLSIKRISEELKIRWSEAQLLAFELKGEGKIEIIKFGQQNIVRLKLIKKKYLE